MGVLPSLSSDPIFFLLSAPRSPQRVCSDPIYGYVNALFSHYYGVPMQTSSSSVRGSKTTYMRGMYYPIPLNVISKLVLASRPTATALAYSNLHHGRPKCDFRHPFGHWIHVSGAPELHACLQTLNYTQRGTSGKDYSTGPGTRAKDDSIPFR